MKIKLNVEKCIEIEKNGIFKEKKVEAYLLIVTLIPSEEENQVYLENSLFKNATFLEYNKAHKNKDGALVIDQKIEEKNKKISISDVFENKKISFKAYSISRLLELRQLILDAGGCFMNTVSAFKSLEIGEEYNFNKKLDAENKTEAFFVKGVS